MTRALATLSLSLLALSSTAPPAWSQTTPAVTLTRLDCGTNGPPTEVGVRMSDTYAFGDLKVQLTFSCYLVRHGNEYLV